MTSFSFPTCPILHAPARPAAVRGTETPQLLAEARCAIWGRKVRVTPEEVSEAAGSRTLVATARTCRIHQIVLRLFCLKLQMEKLPTIRSISACESPCVWTRVSGQ